MPPGQTSGAGFRPGAPAIRFADPRLAGSQHLLRWGAPDRGSRFGHRRSDLAP